MVGSAGSRCEHVFRELYESAFYAERTYLQLKALELLMLLERIPQEAGADAYFPLNRPSWHTICGIIC